MTKLESLSEPICDNQDLEIEQSWVEQLEAISERRETIEYLLRNAKDHSCDVKPAIFERVLCDYQERLALVVRDLAPLAEQVEEKLDDIKGLESLIRSRLDEVDDEIAEQTFRAHVGEFTQDDLVTKAAPLADLRDVLGTQIEIIESTYQQCECHLGALESLQNQELIPEIAPLEMSAPRSPKEEDQTSMTESAPEPEPTTAPEQRIEENLMDAMALTHQPATVEQAIARAELQACLTMFGSKGNTESFELGSNGLSIGKSSLNDIVIRRAGVSRKHAQVALLDDGTFTVTDLSGRGISVNGHLTQESVIKCGDTITIGKVDLDLLPLTA